MTTGSTPVTLLLENIKIGATTLRIMKIGYPCINLTLPCKSNKTFRLNSYSEQRLRQVIENNLNCLFQILRFNVAHHLLFFRITSDLIPFASHPICELDWETQFQEKFQLIGNFIRKYQIRISMHPDQFTLLNSPDERIYQNSIRELLYHAKVLDSLGLDPSAKIQIHVGGVYTDKEESIKRFIRRFQGLEKAIQRRLVIENDDRLYTLKDCLRIYEETGIPILLDVFHHELNHKGETITEGFERAYKTWSEKDGIPMVDYSSQLPDGRRGRHAETLDVAHFKKFIEETQSFDFDMMLEIKNKDKSAFRAMTILSEDVRVRQALVQSGILENFPSHPIEP